MRSGLGMRLQTLFAVSVAVSAAMVPPAPAMPMGEPQHATRFCVAQSPATNSVLITGLFDTPVPIDTLESQFNAWLDGQGLPHRWGICPIAQRPHGPDDDLDMARRFNARFGLESRIVEWVPALLVAP